MKTFKDLEFQTISDSFYNGVTSRIHFENGFGASVVKHDFSYGGKITPLTVQSVSMSRLF